MAETPEWPAYQVGPKDSVFALGVISVSYARLEYAVHAMFAILLHLNSIVSGHLMYKLTPEMRDKLMREMLTTWPWPENIHELCWHFITAHKICYENRNLLMHSNLIAGSEKATVLYKLRRDGKLSLARPSLKELQQVADDMQALGWFATRLSAMIRLKVLGEKPLPGDLAYDTWPDKPPLPKPLEYIEPPPPVTLRPPPAIR